MRKRNGPQIWTWFGFCRGVEEDWEDFLAAVKLGPEKTWKTIKKPLRRVEMLIKS
jgi:hypothetical protein